MKVPVIVLSTTLAANLPMIAPFLFVAVGTTPMGKLNRRLLKTIPPPSPFFQVPSAAALSSAPTSPTVEVAFA